MTGARLAWIAAIRGVYASALELVGVSAPERLERPPAEVESDVT
jgi:arginyl-tRNA synthetase